MGRLGKSTSLALLAMVVCAGLSLFRLQLAGISVLVGVFFYGVKNTKKRFNSVGALDPRQAYRQLTASHVCLWVLLPAIINLIVLVSAKALAPDFLAHVLSRTATFVSVGGGAVLIFQLLLLAVGEEIAWRAVFQFELTSVLSVQQAIVLTSLIFTLGHFAPGNPALVIMDLFLVFINSVLYGVVFSRTNNALVSSLAHFTANLVAIVLLTML